jgi:uncharacterized protein
MFFLFSYMPINASHEFYSAEKKYLESKGSDEQIYWLEEMIRKAPKHKSSENLLKELRIRLKKLKEKKEKSAKKGGGKKGIKKGDFQVLLIGLGNSGKSCLLGKITNAIGKVTDFPFATKEPVVGTMEYKDVKVQVIDMPSLSSDGFDFGIVHTADLLVFVVEQLGDIGESSKMLRFDKENDLIVINKTDRIGEMEKRKLKERLMSEKFNGFLISCLTGDGIEDLKEGIFKKMGAVRVYTKEPGKEKSNRPIVLQSGVKVRDVAEKILKGFSKRIKETRVTGPSGKFVNQKVGLEHELKDGDVVEFKTN